MGHKSLFYLFLFSLGAAFLSGSIGLAYADGFFVRKDKSDGERGTIFNSPSPDSKATHEKAPLFLDNYRKPGRYFHNQKKAKAGVFKLKQLHKNSEELSFHQRMDLALEQTRQANLRFAQMKAQRINQVVQANLKRDRIERQRRRERRRKEHVNDSSANHTGHAQKRVHRIYKKNYNQTPRPVFGGH